MIERTAVDYQQYFLSNQTMLPGEKLLWLKEMREQAIHAFVTCGFPTRKTENWKYTRVNALTEHAFQFAAANQTAAPSLLSESTILNLDTTPIVFINGHFEPSLSDLNSLGHTIQIDSIKHLLASNPEMMKPYFNQLVDYQEHPFAALNTGLMQDGIYLHVPPHVKIEKPIHFIHLSTQPNAMEFPRHLIILGEHAHLTLIESHLGIPGTLYFKNLLTEIFLHRGAKLTHFKFQEDSEESIHISNTQLQQHAQSEYVSHSYSLSGRLVRNDLEAKLIQSGACCTLNGFYQTNEKQHVDNHTAISHIAPNTVSNEYYKGILSRESHAVFNGKVIVSQGAKGTNARQMNKNLLLDTSAEIDTKPELQIYTDDVQCTHGATVGQLDPEAIFYLQSRGIDEKTARDLLVQAFAKEMIDRISISPLRRKLFDKIIKNPNIPFERIAEDV